MDVWSKLNCMEIVYELSESERERERERLAPEICKSFFCNIKMANIYICAMYIFINMNKYFHCHNIYRYYWGLLERKKYWSADIIENTFLCETKRKGLQQTTATDNWNERLNVKCNVVNILITILHTSQAQFLLK